MNPHFIRAGVKPLDRGTFLVASNSVGGKEHHIDLTSYHGAGKCSCADYRCRREQKNAFIRPDEDAAPQRCKHIRAAREFVADIATAGFIRGDGEQREGR